MFRTDEDSAVGNLYVEGEPGVTPATVVSAAAMNAIQEELCAPIEAAGITLDAADRGQLIAALATLSDFATARAAVQNSTMKHDTSGTDVQAFAVKNVSDIVAVGASGLILKSTNGGETWSSQTAAGGYTDDFRCAIWVSSLSLYIIAGKTGEIQTSPDGVTWTHRSAASSYTGIFKDIAFGAGVVVLVGASGEIQSSTNGTAWTRRQTGGAGFIGLHFASSLFVAGNGGGTYHSSNGTTWVSGGSEIVGDIDFGNGLWVGGDAGAVYTSTNGTSWTLYSAVLLETNGTGTDRIIYLGGRLWLRLGPDNVTGYITDDPTKRWIELGTQGHWGALSALGAGPVMANGRLLSNNGDQIVASLYFT